MSALYPGAGRSRARIKGRAKHPSDAGIVVRATGITTGDARRKALFALWSARMDRAAMRAAFAVWRDQA